jgi:hypothetical protein
VPHDASKKLPFFELACVLVRLDYIASVIVNANDGQMIDCDALRSRLRRESSRPRHCDRSYHFVIAVWRAKEAESNRAKYWEIISRQDVR